MKTLLLLAGAMSGAALVHAQTYPDPEFSNEICLLKKNDTGYYLVRLEKSSSKLDTKTKLAGFGGSESGYLIEGGRSPVRFGSGAQLTFVYATGSSGNLTAGISDSMMKANGVDPATMPNLGSMTDPQNSVTLYKTEVGTDSRKILMSKSPSALPFGSKKIKSSEKFSFSVKKIRDGYWILVIDKNLPPGEYAFTLMNLMNMGETMGGGTGVFAFAID